MPLILAIEPDRQQAHLLGALSPRHIDAEMILVPTVDRALEVLATRVPDLLLTPMLMSSRDDGALTARVRELDDQGIAVPILVIPVLAVDDPVAEPPERTGGLFNRMRKARPAPAQSKGCTPEIFAAQIAEYLSRAAAERHDREATAQSSWQVPELTATAPLLAELLPPPAPIVEPAEDTPLLEAFADIASDGQAVTALQQEVTAEDLPDDQIVAAAVAEPTIVEEPAIDLHPVIAIEELGPQPEPISEPAASVDVQLAPETFEAAESSEPTLDDELTIAELDVSPGERDDELWTPLPSPTHLMPQIVGAPSKAAPSKPAARIAKSDRGEKVAAAPARAKRARKAEKPMQDEWGLYDPEQCGFAALLERLDQLAQTPKADESNERGSVIMRR